MVSDTHNSLDTELVRTSASAFAVTYALSFVTHNDEGTVQNNTAGAAILTTALERGDLNETQIAATLAGVAPTKRLLWINANPEHLELATFDDIDLSLAFEHTWEDHLALDLTEHTWDHLARVGDLDTLLTWDTEASDTSYDLIYQRAVRERTPTQLVTGVRRYGVPLDVHLGRLLRWAGRNHPDLYNEALTAALSGTSGEPGVDIPITDADLVHWMTHVAHTLTDPSPIGPRGTNTLEGVLGWRCAHILSTVDETTLDTLDAHSYGNHPMFVLCARFSPNWWASNPEIVTLCENAQNSSTREEHAALITLITDTVAADRLAVTDTDTNNELAQDTYRIAAAAHHLAANPHLSCEHQLALLDSTKDTHMYFAVYHGLCARQLEVDVACAVYTARHRQGYEQLRNAATNPEAFTDAVLTTPGTLDEVEHTLYTVTSAGHFEDRHTGVVRCDALWALTSTGQHPAVATAAATQLNNALGEAATAATARLAAELASNHPGTLEELEELAAVLRVGQQ